MSFDEKEASLLIKKAIQSFPQVLREKEKAFREKEKTLRAFAPFAKWLHKEFQKQKRAKKKNGEP